MVIVKLMGGLGNQMFQYAAGKALARHLNTEFKIDLEFLLDRTPRENFVYRNYDMDIFDIAPTVATKKETKKYTVAPSGAFEKMIAVIRARIAPHNYFFEPHFHFTPDFFKQPENCYLDGYWQTPKYFEAIENEIREDFRFKEPVQPASLELKKAITNENSVCINVRRADFLTNSFHGVCDMKYFNPGIEIMAGKVDNPHFFIFSDDPQWCLENFKLNYPVTFVGHDHAGKKFANYLQLMSLCKHYIIPNSSFAWWAVWLNTTSKDKIVIAPTTWFTDGNWDSKDLIPAHWIRVAN